MLRKVFLLIFLSLSGLFVFSRPALACDSNICNCSAPGSPKVYRMFSPYNETPTGCDEPACLISGPQDGLDGGDSSRPVKIYFCGSLKVGVPSSAGRLVAPNSWLPAINPGFGPTGASLGNKFGLDFFKQNVAAFVVSLGAFLVFILSLIFLIWGGIMWMASGGNKEGAAKAKATITYAIIGLIVGLSAFIIIGILDAFLGTKIIGP